VAHLALGAAGLLGLMVIAIVPAARGRATDGELPGRGQVRRPVPDASRPAPGRTSDRVTAAQVFRAECQKCHDSDGRAEFARETMPTIPDFTDPEWQSSRSDAELRRSILAGKGKSMRPMRDKLGAVDVQQMVALVRAFQGDKQGVLDEPEGRQRVAAAQPTDRRPPAPETVVRPPRPRVDPRAQVGSRLFRQSCTRCHGMDGTGAEMRASLPALPNFRDSAWHARRSDRQLEASILEGKGTLMPGFRGRLGAREAQDLVAYLRALGPGRATTPEPSPSDFEDRFRRLDQEFENLEREIRQLSPPDRARVTGESSPPMLVR
jgi:mono/diheme cytochrome c family protein